MQDIILKRRSIRKYTENPVSEEAVRLLLEAGMSAPSAGDQRPWHFIVITDKEVKDQIPKHHPYAAMTPHAPVVIAVCADLKQERYPGYWQQDCAAATQNILLSAETQGLGAVWLGVQPNTPRSKAIGALFGIPEGIEIFSLIAVGHPAEKKESASRYDVRRIHRDRW
jgi:nitroreductase